MNSCLAIAPGILLNYPSHNEEIMGVAGRCSLPPPSPELSMLQEISRLRLRTVIPFLVFSLGLGATSLFAISRGGVYFLGHSGVSFSFESENTPSSVTWNREGIAVGGGAGLAFTDYLSLAGTVSLSFFGLDRLSVAILDDQGTTIVTGIEAEDSRVIVATADFRFSPYKVAEKFHPIITASAGISSIHVGEVEFVAYNRKTRETSRIMVSGTGTTSSDFLFSLGMGAEIRILESITPLFELRIPLTHTQYLETRLGVRF